METKYFIVALPPVPAVAKPVLPTVTTAELLLSQVPPFTVSLRVAVSPWHSVSTPVIDPAKGSGPMLSVI